MMGLLDGKIVVVTGAGSGIGKQAANASVREGAIVVTGVIMAVDGGWSAKLA